jgi:hypothetical protein
MDLSGLFEISKVCKKIRCEVGVVGHCVITFKVITSKSSFITNQEIPSSPLLTVLKINFPVLNLHLHSRQAPIKQHLS